MATSLIVLKPNTLIDPKSSNDPLDKYIEYDHLIT